MEFIADEPCKTKISKPKDKEIKLFKKGGRNGKKKKTPSQMHSLRDPWDKYQQSSLCLTEA